MHIAAKFGHVDAIQFLISEGGEVNVHAHEVNGKIVFLGIKNISSH